MGRLEFGLGLFIGSLSLGWWLGRRGVLTETRANRLIHTVTVRLSPVVVGLSFWRLEFSGWAPWLVPLAGVALALSTLLPAWWYARLARLNDPQTGSFLTCAVFSNVGFLGALVAFAVAGEAGYGMSTLFLLLFSPCFYAVGFALARRFGRVSHERSSGAWYTDELRLYPLAGLAVGVALSLAHVPRPAVCEWLNQALIPVVTALMLISLGSHIRVVPLSRQEQQAAAVMCAIKFWYTPLVGWGLVRLLGLTGLSRFTVELQSAMPVAVSPLMLPMMFGLNRRMTNALWVVTNTAALAWLWIYLPLIRHGLP